MFLEQKIRHSPIFWKIKKLSFMIKTRRLYNRVRFGKQSLKTDIHIQVLASMSINKRLEEYHQRKLTKQIKYWRGVYAERKIKAIEEEKRLQEMEAQLEANLEAELYNTYDAKMKRTYDMDAYAAAWAKACRNPKIEVKDGIEYKIMPSVELFRRKTN